MTAVDKLLYGDDQNKEVSDLHTVDENADDEPIETKEEARNFVLEEIMHELFMKETFKIAKSQIKVHNFLKMCIWRIRFRKKQAAI